MTAPYSRWKAASRSRKIPICASPMCPTAPALFARKPRSRTDTCSATSGMWRSRGRRSPGRHGRTCLDRMTTATGAAKLSDAPHLGFRLRSPQIIHGRVRLLRGAELDAEIAADLGHAERGFSGDVALIEYDRGHPDDRAGTLLDRLPALAIGLHAAIDVFRTRRRRIIIGLFSLRGERGRSPHRQCGDNRS